MSINKHIGPGLALYQGEMILKDNDGVTATFKKFSHSSEHMKGTKGGSIYLTNFRLLFVNKNKNDMLHELSMPFPQIKDFEIKQPLFGANYLQGRILAEPNGGWEGSACFELTFKDGGAIEIGQKLVELATRPAQMMYPASTATIIVHTNSMQGYAVPGSNNAYCFPAATASAPAYPGPPTNPSMYPQQPPAYAQQMYPPQPPTAYAQQMYPPQPPTAGDAKAMEAAQSNLPPQYNVNGAPPKYDDSQKKYE